jgi:hypothetical protein
LLQERVDRLLGCTQDGERGTHLDLFSRPNEYSPENPGVRGLDFHLRLVGFNGKKQFAFLDGVAFFLKPRHDSPLGHVL